MHRKLRLNDQASLLYRGLGLLLLPAVGLTLSCSPAQAPAPESEQDLEVQVRSPAGPETRLEIPTAPTGLPGSLAISPDGKKVAFVAADGGLPILWVHDLDLGESQSFPETEDAGSPFWSPDGRSIGFTSKAALRTIDLDSGETRRLSNLAGITGGSEVEGIYLGETRPEIVIWSLFGGPDWPPEPRLLLESTSGAWYAPSGHLLFMRENTLYAQKFDPNLLEMTGTAFPVAEGVAIEPGGAGAVSMSMAGHLVYRTHSEGALERQLAWFDRDGTRLEDVGEPQVYLSAPALSPDQSRVAFAGSGPDDQEVLVLDVGSGTTETLTATEAQGGPFGGPVRLFFADPNAQPSPVFSPDNRLAFDLGGTPRVEIAGSNGDTEVLMPRGDRFQRNRNIDQAVRTNFGWPGTLSDWSPDGRYVLLRQIGRGGRGGRGGPVGRGGRGGGGGFDIYASALEGDPQPFSFVSTEFDERDGHFSPDSRWIAYQSDESGRYEIYIQSFPGAGDRIGPVSSMGGVQVQWGPDLDELFYLSLDGRLMSVPLTMSASGVIEAGEPMELFQTAVGSVLVEIDVRNHYMVSADGERFLISTVREEDSPLTVIQNWRPENEQ